MCETTVHLRSVAVELCAPSLFIAGVGKCGTNALAEHLGRHPRVKAMSREVAWDPLETRPTTLVRLKPTYPNETRRVWIVKHPKYTSVTVDIGALASRLRASYPYARVALTLCDPTRLPWRRFLFLLTSATTRHGQAAPVRTAAAAAAPPRAAAAAPSVFSQLVAVLREFNSSVERLFFEPAHGGEEGGGVFNIRGDCTQGARTRALLAELDRRGFGTMYGNAWLRPGAAGEEHCRREWRLALSYAEQLRSWVRALGPINRSVGVVYMEGWKGAGEEYMRRALLPMLGLRAKEYPWDSVSFAQPVFVNTKAKQLVAASSGATPSSMPSWLAACPREVAWRVRQCDVLTQLSGMRPPWCVADGEL